MGFELVRQRIDNYPPDMGFLDEIVGSFSTGADGNPTVAMMDAAFAHEGMGWRYVNCEVPPADLTAAVAGAVAMNWRGFNCSIPHKQTIIAHLDSLAPSAKICQAVNCTVRTDDGRLIGYNTDGKGFLDSLVGLTPVDDLRVTLIGSGGAAYAIAAELALAGASTVAVASRNQTTARRLARLINDVRADCGTMVDWSPDSGSLILPPGTDVVVQATPVGMFPDVDDVVPVDWTSIGADTIAADVVVNPPHTRFLTEAARAGATTLDGTGMLVNQAAENIRLWAGRTVQKSVMRGALEATFPEAN